MPRPATPSQVSYLRHLLQQVGGAEPVWDTLTDIEASALIDGLKQKRGRPVWHGNGQFSHWEKRASAQAARVVRRFQAKAIGSPSELTRQYESYLALFLTKEPKVRGLRDLALERHLLRQRPEYRKLVDERVRLDQEWQKLDRAGDPEAAEARARYEAARAQELAHPVTGLNRVLSKLTGAFEDIETDLEGRLNLYLRPVGFYLFQSLLQQYDVAALGAAVRKTVERASVAYLTSKKKIRVPGGLWQDYCDVWLEQVGLAQTYLQAAKTVLERGARHDTKPIEEQTHAGPFRIVNTGGFDPAKISMVARAVEKASDLIRRAGQTRVLYGDVLVSNTLIRGSLAFYEVGSDEFFVRANVSARKDWTGRTLPVEPELVETIIHELGHRLEYRFSQRDAIQALYETFKNGPRFPSTYAAKDPTENFAECFRLYCLGKLQPKHSELFEPLLHS